MVLLPPLMRAPFAPGFTSTMASLLPKLSLVNVTPPPCRTKSPVVASEYCRLLSLLAEAEAVTSPGGLIAGVAADIGDVLFIFLHGVAGVNAVVQRVVFTAAVAVHAQLVPAVKISAHLRRQ